VEVTSIQIDPGTRDRLKKYGIKDETYSSILNKLMDNMDNVNDNFSDNKNIKRGK
jgi:hypothetical protein